MPRLSRSLGNRRARRRGRASPRALAPRQRLMWLVIAGALALIALVVGVVAIAMSMVWRAVG